MNPILAFILILALIILGVVLIGFVLIPIEYGMTLIGKMFNLNTKIEGDRPTEISASKIMEDDGTHPTVDAGKISFKW